MNDFDVVLDRRNTDSAKWDKYAGRDVIPMWVADMDFKAPQLIIDAIKQRADHGIFGYTTPPVELKAVIIKRMQDLYDWQVSEREILFIPGVVPGLNQACRDLVKPGESIVTATPIYHPFLEAPDTWDRKLHRVPADYSGGEWSFPTDALSSTIADNTDARLLLLCNPFNPVGRVLNREELTRIVEICHSNNTLICSDEIHCDLVFDDRQHIPTATIGREAEDITITLMAPTKTFNLAGMGGAIAIIKNQELRRNFARSVRKMMILLSTYTYTSMLVAYRDCESWRKELVKYLQANRDYLARRIGAIPGITMSPVEATYLAWLEVAQLNLDDAMAFFESAGVGLSDGAEFDGAGFMRLNFACPRATLVEACDRIEKAVNKLTNQTDP